MQNKANDIQRVTRQNVKKWIKSINQMAQMSKYFKSQNFQKFKDLDMVEIKYQHILDMFAELLGLQCDLQEQKQQEHLISIRLKHIGYPQFNFQEFWGNNTSLLQVVYKLMQLKINKQIKQVDWDLNLSFNKFLAQIYEQSISKDLRQREQCFKLFDNKFKPSKRGKNRKILKPPVAHWDPKLIYPTQNVILQNLKIHDQLFRVPSLPLFDFEENSKVIQAWQDLKNKPSEANAATNKSYSLTIYQIAQLNDKLFDQILNIQFQDVQWLQNKLIQQVQKIQLSKHKKNGDEKTQKGKQKKNNKKKKYNMKNFQLPFETDLNLQLFYKFISKNDVNSGSDGDGQYQSQQVQTQSDFIQQLPSLQYQIQQQQKLIYDLDCIIYELDRIK